MTERQKSLGYTELKAARAQARGTYWAVALFSFVVNMLMLTGPLYMLNVYDRVLGSRSVETLIALSVLVGFLYLSMGILDFVRTKLMARAAARFQSHLDKRVFSAVIEGPRGAQAVPEASTGLQDLEAVQRLIKSPALMAVFDLPFMPLFLFGIYIFHPWLGALALGGGALLVLIALINQLTNRTPLSVANKSSIDAERLGEQIRAESELVRSLGMRDAVFSRWKGARDTALSAAITASDAGNRYSALTKTLRLMMQSAMLGLGAYLVLQDEMTAGAMIAGSILLGRALAPVELLIGQWAIVQRGREAWSRLAYLLGAVPQAERRTELPVPNANVQADKLVVIPPGETQPALRMLSFKATPGQAIGVIGTSGAGKSTLARALTGVWPIAAGSLRLDGAAIDQYEPDTLGKHIGYLPQRVELFEGSIRDNIARMSPNPDDAEVVRAAKTAAAHEMILKLPDGYDTKVSPSGGRLSGGQIQRIGLARAMYGDPVVLVLDEPNSNLDNEGSTALNNAIRNAKANGKSVLIMAHRPAAIQECDTLLVLDAGTARAFGPKDEVLREIVKNHAEIKASTGVGGVS